MGLEIIERQNDITFDVAKVEFPAYHEYLDKAQQVAGYILSMEVTPDTVRGVKKTLADARKLTDRLNALRISMKKEILSNFNTFESQVKEIAAIVDEADADLRAKVKSLEEAEKETKKAEIKAIWDKRAQQSGIEAYMPDAFTRWLSPRHLNKTTSMKSVESDMAGWMAAAMGDVATAEAMGGEYLVEYIRTGSLREAIAAVQEKARIADSLPEQEDMDQTPAACFIVTGAKDIAFAETLFKQNEINYKRKEI